MYFVIPFALLDADFFTRSTLKAEVTKNQDRVMSSRHRQQGLVEVLLNE